VGRSPTPINAPGGRVPRSLELAARGVGDPMPPAGRRATFYQRPEENLFHASAFVPERSERTGSQLKLGIKPYGVYRPLASGPSQTKKEGTCLSPA